MLSITLLNIPVKVFNEIRENINGCGTFGGIFLDVQSPYQDAPGSSFY